MTITPKQILAKSSDIVVTLTVINMKTEAVIDLSGASLIEFRLRANLLKAVAKAETAAFVTDGQDGQIQFTTSKTTFDVSGDWNVQAYIEMAGYEGYTTSNVLKVLPVIEA